MVWLEVLLSAMCEQMVWFKVKLSRKMVWFYVLLSAMYEKNGVVHSLLSAMFVE